MWEVLWTKERMCSRKECVRKGTKEGMCLERDKGRNVFGKGQRKGGVPFLTRVGTCKAREGKVFANVSAGIDRKSKHGGGGAL